MRRLPRKKSRKQNLIIQAVFDYFGLGIAADKKQRANMMALWLMKRKKGIQLTEEELEDVEKIKQNLQDKTYVANLS